MFHLNRIYYCIGNKFKTNPFYDYQIQLACNQLIKYTNVSSNNYYSIVAAAPMEKNFHNENQWAHRQTNNIKVNDRRKCWHC